MHSCLSARRSPGPLRTSHTLSPTNVCLYGEAAMRAASLGGCDQAPRPTVRVQLFPLSALADPWEIVTSLLATA
jgi:hypothetical protein